MQKPIALPVRGSLWAEGEKANGSLARLDGGDLQQTARQHSRRLVRVVAIIHTGTSALMF